MLVVESNKQTEIFHTNCGNPGEFSSFALPQITLYTELLRFAEIMCSRSR